MNPTNIAQLITENISENNGLALENAIKKDPARLSSLIGELNGLKKKYMNEENNENKEKIINSGITLIKSAYDDKLIDINKAMTWIQITFPGIQIAMR